MVPRLRVAQRGRGPGPQRGAGGPSPTDFRSSANSAIVSWHREVDFGPDPALPHAELGFLAEQRGDAPGAPLPEAERGDVERITARALAALGARTFAAEYSTDADDDDPDLGDHGGPTAGEG
ncbi:hypothetical protein RI578_37015 [Streptomyces sp. BB1-1-1]|uniref:hypothetical protein n=1 Tax=Streptomyces sp. BB1-1-1 TaxID=3074430 RepID=UPI002877AF13|nr:hypothetical protein [Streptomyces sp. BB1-1-1]WND39554.1 hypothetical protein RI578_37015 [Streptomyces sp. BB1-1-1]